MFNILENPFIEFKNEYLHTKYLEDHNLYFPPKTIVVGYKQEKKTLGIERQLIVPIQGHLLSL